MSYNSIIAGAAFVRIAMDDATLQKGLKEAKKCKNRNNINNGTVLYGGQIKMVFPPGVEPGTCSLGGSRSIRMSYGNTQRKTGFSHPQI